MGAVQSRLTAQGQISVPAEIRRKLGIGPGSVIQWEEHDGQIVVRKAGKYTSLDVHKALFPDGPPKRKTLAELKEGLGQAVAEKYLRSQRARR